MKNNSPVGLYSSKGNPMPAAKQVPIGVGSGTNKDKSKVDSLIKKANAEKDSMRGKSGM